MNAAVLAARADGDIAQAVWQGADGAWQLAPLVQKANDGSLLGMVVDGPNVPAGTKVSAQRLADELKAIVGRSTVFNYTDQPTPAIRLFGADAWKGEDLAKVSTTSGSRYGGRDLTLRGLGDAEEAGRDLGNAIQQAMTASRDGSGLRAVVKGDDDKFYLSHVIFEGAERPLRLRDITNADPSSASLFALVGTTGSIDLSSKAAALLAKEAR